MKEIDNTNTLDCFLHHDCLCQGFCRKQAGPLSNGIAIKRFIGFLAAQNLIQSDCLALGKTFGEDLTEFRTWLRRHRGIQGYADDFVVGFQYKRDTDECLRALKDRMEKFAFELHQD